MKKFGKMVAITMTGVMLLSLTACNSDSGDGGSASGGSGSNDKKLVIWSFTDELEVQGDIEYFKSLYTGPGQKWEGYDVELSIIPTEDYLTKLLPVLESGKGMPDLFTGELDTIQNFMEAGYVADLDALIAKDEDSARLRKIVDEDYVDYIVESGKDADGVQRALSWQVTPGSIMFRTDLAVQIWGSEMAADNVDTTNSDSIGEWMHANKFNTLEQLTATSVEADAAGNYRLFSDIQAIRHYAGGNDPVAWVVDGHINPAKMETQITYMETAKQLYGESFMDSLTANAGEWSGEWFSGISGPITPIDADGQSYEIIAYSLPTWGLFHVLEPNMQVKDENQNVIDEGTFGKWALADGPSFYFWGGTYLVINEQHTDEKKELAFDFLKTMTFDDERMITRATELGDIYSRISIMDAVGEGFEGRPSLNNQNHIEFFMEEADRINLDYVTKYDRSLNSLLSPYTESYMKGMSTLDEALNAFYEEVSIVYGKDFITDELPLKK